MGVLSGHFAEDRHSELLLPLPLTEAVSSGLRMGRDVEEGRGDRSNRSLTQDARRVHRPGVEIPVEMLGLGDGLWVLFPDGILHVVPGEAP
jgi:hypothetical protein